MIPSYGGFEQCDPDYLVQRENIEFSTLELVVGGQGTVRMNDTTHPLTAGTIFHYDHSTRLEIRTDPAQPMAKYFLCFRSKRISTKLRAAGVPPTRARRLAMFPEVQHLLEELIREGQHHRATTGRICEALIVVLLLKLEELVGFAGPKGTIAEETFLRSKAGIEVHAARLATLNDITQAVGVEASQLCRLFRRYQGLSPYQFLLHRKMALAAELLMDPTTLVKEAASRVGFADPFHFSRCFKKVHRVAPKEFQRSLKHL